MRAVSTALFYSEVCALLALFGKESSIHIDDALCLMLLRSITKELLESQGYNGQDIVYIVHIYRCEGMVVGVSPLVGSRWKLNNYKLFGTVIGESGNLARSWVSFKGESKIP